MAREKSKDRIVFQNTGGDFIDPVDTGSYIRYKVIVKVCAGDTPDKNYLHTDFAMTLGDCSRVINWDFENYEDKPRSMKIEKIDYAIKILTEARLDMIKAEKSIQKEQAVIDKAKEAVKKKV